MANVRNLFIHGEALVYVKSGADAPGDLSAKSELGLSVDPIQVSLNFNFEQVVANAWGRAPFEVQWMGAIAQVSMNLVHFDRTLLDACLQQSMGGGGAIGQVGRAGARMGNNAARFAAGYKFIGLNIFSPVAGKHWRFYHTYLSETPMQFPLGVERSVVQLNWTAVPYTTDPWGGGTGANNAVLWDHNQD